MSVGYATDQAIILQHNVPEFCRLTQKKVFHVGQPNIGDRAAFAARVDDILERRWLSNDGPMVREFERRISEFVGVKHCIAMCNATVALQLVTAALGLKGEVILPSFTFVATAHALKWQGITPVFADVDRKSHNIDPKAVERLVTPETTGIIGVHVWGRPCDTAGLQSIAGKHGLSLVFDAAHAFGSTSAEGAVGSFGICEVFSFHATKFVNSLEGGAVTTNDDELARSLRLTRNFGFEGFDNVISLGLNGKMNEVSAAMGITSLEAMDEIIATNRRNYFEYSDQLKGIEGVTLLPLGDHGESNFQYVVVEVDEVRFGVSRDALVDLLHRDGVMARRYFWPGCHRMAPYVSTDPDAGERLPNTNEVASRVIVLPTGQAVGSDDVARISRMIREAAS